MRTTRQGPTTSEGGDNLTIQQIMETMKAFQSVNEEA